MALVSMTGYGQADDGRGLVAEVRTVNHRHLDVACRLPRAWTALEAEVKAEERILDALVGDNASADTRSKFRQMLRNGDLADKDVELDLQDSAGMQRPTLDIPGMPGG